MRINYESTYDSYVCTVITEVNPTLNIDTFAISLNYLLNLGIFGLSVGSLPTWEQKGVYVENLAAKWMINLDYAKTKLGPTTQLVIRSSENPSISQIFNTNDRMLRYNRITFVVFIDTIFLGNTSKSKCQFTCVQVFVADFGYTHTAPMKSKKGVHRAMKYFFKNVGVTPAIFSDFVG